MNKETFLSRLDKALGNISWNDKKEIIYDYEEYFENALADGKSEEETAQELGQPEEIALHYLEDNQDQNSSNSDFKGIFDNVIKKVVNGAVKLAETAVQNSFSGKKQFVEKALLKQQINCEKIRLENCNSADVRIVTHAEDSVDFLLSGSGYFPESVLPELESQEDKDGYKLRMKWHVKNPGFKGSLTVRLPEKSSKSFNIKTTSGDLKEFPDNKNNLLFKTVSGKIKLERLQLKQNLDFQSVSGDIKTFILSCSNLNMKAVSGDLTAEKLEAKKFTADLTSGDLKFGFASTLNELKVKTVSGKIKMNLLGENGIDLRFKSVSGKFKTDLQGQLNDQKGYGSRKAEFKLEKQPCCKIEIKTVSGSCKLLKGENYEQSV